MGGFKRNKMDEKEESRFFAIKRGSKAQRGSQGLNKQLPIAMEHG
jgi:hypothetical protein